MNKLNPRQITLARESRGMTQGELVNLLQPIIPAINQGNLSKIERGLIQASDNTISAMSSVLNYPHSFFFIEDYTVGIVDFNYRKKVSVAGSDLKKLQAVLTIIANAIGCILNDVEMDMKFKKLAFDLDGGWDIKHSVAATRNLLSIPKGPVNNLISHIEKVGIIIYYTKFDLDGFDGMTILSEAGWPIIFINKHRPNDRIKMTIAHELAHICLHFPFAVNPSRDKEHEAKEFAGEFLMPQKDSMSDLLEISSGKLTELKEYWGVSKAAIIYNAYKANILNKSEYIYLKDFLSRNGERINEKGYVELDKPTLLNRILSLYKDSLAYSESEMAEVMHLSIADYLEYFSEDNDITIKKLVPIL